MISSQNEITTKYSSDFYAWTQEQSKLLREKKWTLLDVENLAEEIESLGRQERKELVNRLGVLLGHLLKWNYQPEGHSRSWEVTIREQRRKIKNLLAENPSLKAYFNKALEEGYRDGLALVLKETPLDESLLPVVLPYTAEQLLNDDFLP